MAPKSPRRPAQQERSVLRGLTVLVGIFILTASLTARTVDLNLQSQTSVASQTQKAKIQHRDQTGSQWTPALNRLKPFYVEVSSEAVEPEQEPLLSAHVDDCLYNRPPPLA